MNQSGFNPKARWDRNIPQTDDYHPPEELNERIQVLAWFRNGKIYPNTFIWHGKSYKIRQITYNWQERQGKGTICCFSVNTGEDLYQISFNNTTLGWRIDKVII